MSRFSKCLDSAGLVSTESTPLVPTKNPSTASSPNGSIPSPHQRRGPRLSAISAKWLWMGMVPQPPLKLPGNTHPFRANGTSVRPRGSSCLHLLFKGSLNVLFFLLLFRPQSWRIIGEPLLPQPVCCKLGKVAAKWQSSLLHEASRRSHKSETKGFRCDIFPINTRSALL